MNSFRKGSTILTLSNHLKDVHKDQGHIPSKDQEFKTKKIISVDIRVRRNNGKRISLSEI